MRKQKRKKEVQLDLLSDTDRGNFGHGGARVGSGRKAGEKTVVMRVPESVAPRVRELIEHHKSGAKSFEEFCQRYELDEQADHARDEYQAYLDNLDLMNIIFSYFDKLSTRN